MADEAIVLTVSDDEQDEAIDCSSVDKPIPSKRKATGAASHMCLKRVEGKRVRLTNEQKAEISVFADKHEQLSREDILAWAVKI